MKKPAKPTRRRNLSVIVTMPPLEKQRLAAFARKLGRPVSWIVRDAVRAYVEAAGPNVDALARKLRRLDIAGNHVPLSRMGRPPKKSPSKSDKKP